jgi:hypothetical protein
LDKIKDNLVKFLFDELNCNLETVADESGIEPKELIQLLVNKIKKKYPTVT